MSTWRDRDHGVRVVTVTCRTCGRGVYLPTTAGTWAAVVGLQPGEIARCVGCGNVTGDCWCPPVPRPEAIP